MSNITAIISRDCRGNWSAVSRIALFAAMELKITTSKRSCGKLISSATVHKVSETCETYRVYHDYTQTIETTVSRCTEKTVRLQHERALAQLPALKAAALAHYAELGEYTPSEAQEG